MKLAISQFSIKHLILLIVFLITFFPYTSLNVANESFGQQFSSLSRLSLQVICIAFLISCFARLSSRSLRLFWLYFSFAATCALLSFFLPSFNNLITEKLLQDFITLLIYFFILLAIETNPHLSDAPLNKYSSGRVPALFFTLICFCYFILLPAEFAKSTYLSSLPSIFFNLVINLVIVIRLAVCIINSNHSFWRYTFILLLAAGSAMFIDNMHYFEQVNLALELTDNKIQSNISYITQLLTLLPYTLLILAANLSLSPKKSTNKAAARNSKNISEPNLYLLLLTLLLVGLHFYGTEFQLFYLIDTHLQSLVVFLWLVIASTLVFNQTLMIRAKNTRLKQKINQYLALEKQLSDENNKLSEAFINSEDKAIVRASNNAILTATTKGKILSANPAAVQMFQQLERELIGNSVSTLFSKKDEMHYFFDFDSNVYSLQRKDLGISVESTSLRFDGAEFPTQTELQWAERESQPLIVLTFINLTERKLAEKQTLEQKDLFIANISHEFRTPLTIINGIIDRYITKTTNSEEQENLTTAKRNGLRLVRMVEQLLELSRLSANPKLSISNYRLSNLMKMPIDSFSRLSKQRKLSFSSQIDNALWLECDAQAFENIIFNLLANAVKYTPEGGDIKVLAYSEQDTLILDVIDSGIGINKNSQSDIFKRFQRADDPLNQGTFGVGIGLSLVSELVKAHGWRINLTSEQGHGSKFSLSMPLAIAQSIETDLPISLSENEVASLLIEPVSASAKQNQHSQQVVLVIEDNIDMQSHIKQVIEQQHHCILAGSGELGLELAQEFLPDLIVCDLMLTGIDGFEVLKTLKEGEVTAHIPIILLTARSDLESRLHGLKLNADEYLSKPFNQDELLTRIQSLIDNRKLLQQSYLKSFNDEQKSSRLATSQDNLTKLTDSNIEEISLDDKFLTKLEGLIAEHYTEPSLDIASLSKELAMSERQLQRKIKSLLGTKPNNFIKDFRLKKAQELLKSGAQIGRIALDVGFSSQTYFGRCFKESFGCTPKQYQQRIKDES